MSGKRKVDPSGPEHFPNLAATISRAISAAALLHLHFVCRICAVCCMPHATRAGAKGSTHRYTNRKAHQQPENPQLSHQLGHNLGEENGGLEFA